MVIEALVSVVDAIRNSTILKSIREMARITDENNQYLDNKMDTVTTAASEATTAANQATAKLDEKVTEINTAVNNVNTAVNTVNGYNTRLTTVETISAGNTERIIDNEAGIEALEDELGSSDLPGTIYYKIDQLETADVDNFKKTSSVRQDVSAPTVFSGGLSVTSNNNSITEAAIGYADINNMEVNGRAIVPTTPATTKSAVNQTYVESTTSGVNNIVHKSGEETITTRKFFKECVNGHISSCDYINPSNKTIAVATTTSLLNAFFDFICILSYAEELFVIKIHNSNTNIITATVTNLFNLTNVDISTLACKFGSYNDGEKTTLFINGIEGNKITSFCILNCSENRGFPVYFTPIRREEITDENIINSIRWWTP